MNKLMAGVALAFAVLARPLVAAEPEVPGTGCDRSCLYGIVDQYFTALDAHQPSRAPTIRLVKFTENGVRMSLGDGLWNTYSGRRMYNLRAADVPRGQVTVFEVVEEHGIPALLAARFRIANRQIVEIETVVSRQVDVSPFVAIDKLTRPDPLWSTPVDEALRQPRERLTPLADTYFNTLQQNNRTLLTQFTDDCNRVENGLQATVDASVPEQDVAEAGCAQQFAPGQHVGEQRLRDRRFPLVDQEMGIVLAAGFIDHTGKIVDSTGTDGMPEKSDALYPHSFIYFELFKVENNAIRRMESVFARMPYNMPSVW